MGGDECYEGGSSCTVHVELWMDKEASDQE
jgi:hypothetical protein